MKFVSLAAAVLLLLYGCGADSGVKIKLDTKEYVTDVLNIKAQIPSFSGMGNRDFENSLNEIFETDINAWIEEFMTSVPENTKSEFSAEQSVKYNKNGFVSVVTDIYTYTGGAHGTLARKCANIDTEKGAVLTLGELFSADSSYREMLNRSIAQIIHSDPEQYGDLWEQPVLTDRQEEDFYIEGGKLTVYYPPYELSYYSKGFVEFEVSLADMRSYLKEEYRRMVE